MVGAPTVETDQPQAPVETEVPEAPAPEIAAPEEPTGPAAEPETPEPQQYVTREELERIQRETREQAERDAAERLRRDNQRRNALQARERQQEQEAREMATQRARMAFHDAGITAEPETITPAFEGYVKTYRTAWERTVETDATDGFVIAAADVLGVALPAELEPSERAYTYGEGVKSYVKGLYDQAYAKARQDLQKEMVPRAELPTLIEGALKKRLNEQKPTDDFKGPEGQANPAGPGLTADQYAAMSPVEQRRLQRERPDLINAMTQRLSQPQR